MKIIMSKSKMVFKKESYTELTWIIPTSTSQIFRSPVGFPKAGKAEITIFMITGGTAGRIFGYRDYVSANRINANREIVSSNNRLYVYLNSNSSQIYAANIAEGETKKIALTRAAAFVDGVSVATPSVTTGFDDSVEFGMVGLVYKKTSTTYENEVATSIKFGGFKMWSDASDESSLVVDAIPVLRGNGDVCYYDRISGTYITSEDGTNPNYE